MARLLKLLLELLELRLVRFGKVVETLIELALLLVVELLELVLEVLDDGEVTVDFGVAVVEERLMLLSGFGCGGLDLLELLLEGSDLLLGSGEFLGVRCVGGSERILEGLDGFGMGGVFGGGLFDDGSGSLEQISHTLPTRLNGTPTSSASF